MDILIVDDEQDILKSFEIGLEDVPCRLTLCSSPLKAIELFKANSYDLVFSDIRMAEMDGLELLKTLVVLKKPVRFVVMTAFAEPKTALDAYKMHVYSFMVKPLDIREVIQLIEDTRFSNEQPKK